MTKSYLNKLLIVGMAVSALLVTSACSRKGGQKPVQTTQAPAPAPNQNRSELDNDSGRSSQDGPVVSEDEEIDQDSDIEITSPSIPQGNPQNSGAVQDDDIVLVQYDPSGKSPAEVFEASERQGPSAVGDLSTVGGRESGLRYSGAGQDNLREQLMRHEKSKEKSRRDRDRLFAQTLNQVTVDVDWSTRQGLISVLMNGRRTQLNFRGSIAYDDRSSKLKSSPDEWTSRQGLISVLMNGRRTQLNFRGSLTNDLLIRAGSVKRGKRIAVEAACMDLHGGCETVYLKIQDGNHGQIRTAHVISRTTTATLFTQGNGYEIAKNEEYNYFLNLLLNTVGHSGAMNTINSLWMRTTEVIGGSSNYLIQMGLLTSRSGQTSLNWTGALVKPANSASLNAPGEMLYSTSPIANTIRETSLVKNDGRGNIQLAVTIRKGTVRAQEDTLLLTFGRIHKPTVPLRVK